jgi:hypothetical protein
MKSLTLQRGGGVYGSILEAAVTSKSIQCVQTLMARLPQLHTAQHVGKALHVWMWLLAATVLVVWFGNRDIDVRPLCATASLLHTRVFPLSFPTCCCSIASISPMPTVGMWRDTDRWYRTTYVTIQQLSHTAVGRSVGRSVGRRYWCRTALHKAACAVGASRKRKNAAQPWAMTAAVLVQNKADPNARDKNNVTPLMLAAYYGHGSIIKLLKVVGDTSLRDDKGRTYKEYLTLRARKRKAPAAVPLPPLPGTGVGGTASMPPTADEQPEPEQHNANDSSLPLPPLPPPTAEAPHSAPPVPPQDPEMQRALFELHQQNQVLQEKVASYNEMKKLVATLYDSQRAQAAEITRLKESCAASTVQLAERANQLTNADEERKQLLDTCDELRQTIARLESEHSLLIDNASALQQRIDELHMAQSQSQAELEHLQQSLFVRQQDSAQLEAVLAGFAQKYQQLEAVVEYYHLQLGNHDIGGWLCMV